MEVIIPQDIEVKCRYVQITQVLVNLINNSIDALQNNPLKWIKIELTTQEKTALLSVTDSGEGIPESISAKIMQPFISTKEAGKGLGLGLSISKGIVESHDGQLKYDSQSKHTKFTIALPIHS